MGLWYLFALGCVWLVFTIKRKNPLKAVLESLPDEPDRAIAALEDGLAHCNPYDVGTNSMARYRLMELYKVGKRYEEAVEEGRSILAMKGVKHELENEVRGDCHLPRLPGPYGAGRDGADGGQRRR